MGVLRIGLEWFKNPDHLPFFIAEELGWFAEAGLETILVVPDIHLDALQVLTLSPTSVPCQTLLVC